jgi:predicted HTH domain antitoxin
MALEKYEKSLSKIKVLILLLLDSLDGKPIKGKLSLQKQIFLLSRYLGLENEALYEPHHYGPYSEVVDIDLEQLVLMDLAHINDEIRITEEGRKLAEKIKEKIDKEKLKLIDEVKEWLYDLDNDELMALIYFSFPEMAIESRELERIRRKRVMLAASLYAKGKISLEKAADIAGMSLVDFMNFLKKRKIPIEINL